MSEEQKLKADRAEAERVLAEAKETALNARLESAAIKLGFADPEDAALVNRELLGGGSHEEVVLALKELLQRKPHLKGQVALGDTPMGGRPAGSTAGKAAEDRAAELKKRFGF